MSIKANIFLIGQIVKSTPGAVGESAILAADLAIKNKRVYLQCKQVML